MNSFRYFKFLAAGKLISDIGTYFDMVALNLYVYRLTGSAFHTGLFMAVRLFGGFLAGFYSGLLADRVNRKVLMITADLARGAALLLLVASPPAYHSYLLYGVALVIGVFASLFEVALQSAIPNIVGPDHRVKANAILGSCASIAMVIGCTGAGVMVGVLGYRGAFLLDGLTYLASAVNLMWLPMRMSEGKPAAAKAPFFHEVKVIFQYFRTIPILLGMLLLRLADAFGSASHNVGVPIYSSVLRPDRPSLIMGTMYATWAVGKLISSFLSAKVPWMATRMRDRYFSERAFGYATVLMSASFIAVFWSPNVFLVGLFSIAAGIADGVSEIAYSSRLQEVPDGIRGRAFGVAATMQTVGFGVGMVLCSPLFDLWKPGAVVTVLHGIPLIMCMVFIWFCHKTEHPLTVRAHLVSQK